MSTTLSVQTRAYGLSVAITCILSAILMIAKESNEALLQFMKTVTVHHWVTHGIFNILVFLILGQLLSKINGGQGPDIDDEKLGNVIVGGFLISSVAIAGFMLL